MPVDFEEMHGSPTEQATFGGFNAAMRLKCAWTDRIALLSQFLATPTLYPHDTSLLAYATNGTSEPFGGSDDGGSGLITYDHAIVTINFSTRSPDGREPAQTYSEDLEPYIENLPLPVRDAAGVPLYTWPASGSPPSKDPLDDREAPVRQLKGCVYSLTRYNQTTIPSAAFSLIGKVNASAVVSYNLGVTFEAQTLLHTPPVLNRTATTAGVSDWTLKYRWNYKPNFDPSSGVAQGWNKFWRAKTGTFENILKYSDGAIQLIYPTGNFTLL